MTGPFGVIDSTVDEKRFLFNASEVAMEGSGITGADNQPVNVFWNGGSDPYSAAGGGSLRVKVWYEAISVNLPAP